MKPTTVITAGEKYTEIDTLACAIGYQEFLGNTSLAVLPGPFNHSITSPILNWDLKFLSVIPKGEFQFAIVDVSDPDYIAKFVDQKRIFILIDHHFGFEEYWRNRLDDRAHIENVGACATQIWEEFQKAGHTISTVSANLLSMAIVSNTLNFNASVTSERDRTAFAQLESFTSLPNSWIEDYFSEQQDFIEENLQKTLGDDLKQLPFPSLETPVWVAQLELWSGEKVLKNRAGEVISYMEIAHPDFEWLVTAPSISQGKNFFLTNSERIKKVLFNSVGAQFGENLGTSSKLWMRKEIIREVKKLSS